MRYAIPLVVAAVCLVVATKVGAIVAYVLIVVAFACIFDVSTKWIQQAGSAGRLTDHRQ